MKRHLSRIPAHHRARLHRSVRRAAHVLWYGAAVVGAVLAIGFAAARAFLPTVAEKKDEIEAFLSQQSGYTVRIETLSAYWDGFHPGLQMQGIGVYAPNATRAAVRLAELRISLKILPLLIGRTDIHSAVLTHPSLSLERLSDGRFRISGFDAIEQPDAAQNEAFVGWLFRQDRIALEDGELQWIDRREAGPPPRLTHVNLELTNNGARHRLGLSAEFPQGICGGCSVVADIRGNPFSGEEFDGKVYLRARDVDVERMPRILHEQLPSTLRGKFSVELWSDWEDSRPVAVDGDVETADLRLPLTGLRAPLSVKRASAALHWKSKNDGFDATLKDLTLALHGAPWSAGQWQFALRKEQASLRMERINLTDVTAFIASLKPAGSKETLPYEESAALWGALRPSGWVKNIEVQLKGVLDAPDDYTFAADVERLGIEPYQVWPGVHGASGRVSLGRERGSVALDMRNGELLTPQVFRAPIPIAHAAAGLRWQREADQWLVTVDDLAFENEDGRAQGQLSLRVPQDPEQSPHLALKVDVRDAKGSSASRYYPTRLLSSQTLAWMERSFGAGAVSQATVIYDGQTRDFPFTAGQGKFEVRAKVRDAVYNYLPGWEPITDVTADVLVEGERFFITGHGRIGALKANEVTVVSDAGAIVRVRANVAGPVAETMRVLKNIKGGMGAGVWKAWLPPELEAAGDGTLSLDLAVPVASGEVQVGGEYQFNKGMLRYAGVTAARDITGSLRFNDAGVREGRLRANVLGDETVLVIAHPTANETAAAIQGRITAAGLAPVLGPKISARLNGAVPWEGLLRIVKGRPEFSAELDLSGMRALLPAPLDRPNGLSPEKLRVRTETSSRDSLTLSVTAGGLVQGRARFVDNDGWRLQSGRIIFNETPKRVPPELLRSAERGLHVFLRLDDFNLDQWLTYSDDGYGPELPAWLTRVGFEAGALTLLDRPFGRVNVDLGSEKNGWGGAVNGAAAAGRVQLRTVAPTRIDLDLVRLIIPPATTKQVQQATDPRKFANVTLHAQSLQASGRDFGEVNFAAHPVEQGWKIERAAFLRPDAHFEANGLWRREHNQSSSQFNILFSGQDLGKMLTALGYPDQMDSGEAELNAKLSWNGAPGDVVYASLSGSVEIDAKKGRFPQVSQGAARLFGVLDLSAIGRYLTLDFSPIFGKGFAFDRIHGKLTLERGTVYTDELTIKGPSARILVSGSVGLAAEDFHLVLDVYPSLAGGLTVTSLLAGGPQVALWSLLVQRLFKKQIEDGMRVTYLVNGPWKNPEITRKVVEGKTPGETEKKPGEPE